MLKKLGCAVLAITFSLSACGGGGGGGEGGGGGSAPRGVRILHGAIDAAPIDVYTSLSPGALIQRASFASTQLYSLLPEGQQTLTVTRAKTPSVEIRSFNVDVQSRQRMTLVLFGDNQQFGLSTRLLTDEIPEERGEGTLLRVFDGMTGASELLISIRVPNAPRNQSTTTRVAYGNATPYLSIPSGVVRVTAQRAADAKILSSVDITLDAGEAYTLLVGGEADYYVKSTLYAD
jgi:hypothetical protein